MSLSTLSAIAAMTPEQRDAFERGELVIVYAAGMTLDTARKWANVIDADAIRANRLVAQRRGRDRGVVHAGAVSGSGEDDVRDE